MVAGLVVLAFMMPKIVPWFQALYGRWKMEGCEERLIIRQRNEVNYMKEC